MKSPLPDARWPKCSHGIAPDLEAAATAGRTAANTNGDWCWKPSITPLWGRTPGLRPASRPAPVNPRTMNTIPDMPLHEAVILRPLLGDGAMGTQLMLGGLEQGGCG